MKYSKQEDNIKVGLKEMGLVVECWLCSSDLG